VPYDPFIVILAFFSYGFAWEQLVRLWRAFKARRALAS
jgi:hypothetical protein